MSEVVLSAVQVRTLLELAALLPGLSQALTDIFREHVKQGKVEFLLVAIPKDLPTHPVFTASAQPDQLTDLRTALNGALEQIDRNGGAIRLAVSDVQGHA